MFIEQSVGRRRVVRLLFVALGVVPCGVLIAMAWWLNSAGHRECLERDVAAHLGVPVSVGRVVHVRPGALRLERVVVGNATAGAVIELPEVDVEKTAEEVRLRVPEVACPPPAARLLGDLASEWLRRPARFTQSWVVDAANVTWQPDADRRLGNTTGWHVECVVANAARAVRVRREPAGDDEIRVHAENGTVTVEGALAEGIPVAVAAALVGGAGLGPGVDTLGIDAVVSGRIEAASQGDGWSGSFSGRVSRLDLAATVSGLRGEAELTFSPLRFQSGRVAACDLLVSARAGTVAQDWLDSLVAVLGCRPGPAYRALGGDPVRRFDQFECRLQLDGDRLRIVSQDVGSGSIIRCDGLSLVEVPSGPLPASRVAWLLSPAGRPAMPASPTSAWLISVLPDPGGGSGF